MTRVLQPNFPRALRHVRRARGKSQEALDVVSGFVHRFTALPGVEGVGHTRHVFGLEVAQHTIFHVAQIAGVDEQNLALAVLPPVAAGFALGEKPDAGRYLCVGEQLARQGHHAFHQVTRRIWSVAFNQGFANVAFVICVAAHRAIGQEQGHAAVRGQVVHHVLQPREVGIAVGGHAVLPAHVAILYAFFPRLHVEGRIGHDEVGPQVGVLGAGVGAGRLLAEVVVQATDGHVHAGQAPGGGIGFLAVDADLTHLATVLFHETFALHEEAAAAAAGVVYAALVGLQHFHDERDNALGRIELTTPLASGDAEFTQEVFVDVAQDVLGLERAVVEGDG